MKKLIASLGLAALSFAALSAPLPLAPTSAPVATPATDITKPMTPAIGAPAQLGRSQAATQAHNTALLSRRDQCVALIHQGVIRPTAKAQLACLLKGAPASPASGSK
ncbi:hypothetical protein [Roseateles sp. MS654]|uniref:hypothetical protein n=1 Tax=Roseateles sp. MS654 TaxID=3412685 RepID=UPI003C30E37A